MNNKKLVLLIFPLILGVTGCLHQVEEDDGLVHLTWSSYIANGYTDISYEQFVDKMVGGHHIESFCILVYNNCGCATTTTVQSILNTYAAEQNMVFYALDGQDARLYDYKYPGLSLNGPERNLGLSYANSYPTVSIVKDGVVKYTQKFDQALYENKGAGIKEFIETHTVKSKMFKVNEDYLTNNPIDEGIIYFGRNGCTDCQYIEPNILFPYMKNVTSEVPFYAFDIQDVWAQDYGEEATKEQKEAFEHYKEFKDRWLLSNKNSPEFGYENGVVPTFHYYKNGVLTDAAIYANEKVEKQGDKVVVTKSYYDGTRNNAYIEEKKNFIGLDVTNDVVNFRESYYLPIEVAAKRFNPLITAFFDYYLK